MNERRKFFKDIGKLGLGTLAAAGEAKAGAIKELFESIDTSEKRISQENIYDFLERGENLNLREVFWNEKKNYEKRLLKDPRITKDFYHSINSLQEIGLENLKNIFAQKGIDENFAWVIPTKESWMRNSISKAGAVGWFQIKPKVVDDLIKKKKIDERYRKIGKSFFQDAEVSATLVKDNQKVIKSDDFLLNLATYNLGASLSGCRKKIGAGANFENLLDCFEEKILNLKNDFENGNLPIYPVQKGDSLNSIAKNYKIPLEKLKEANGKKDDMIRIGERLKLPFENFEACFKNLNSMKRIREAFEYMPRSAAIMQIVKDDNLLPFDTEKYDFLD